MKKIILLLTLFSSAFLSAQYQPFAVEGRQWNEYFSGQISSGTQYFTYGGDSALVGRKFWQILEQIDTVNGSQQFDTAYLFRENPNRPSITILNHIFGPSDSVYLDLGMAVGDSFVYEECDTFRSSYYRLDSVGTLTDQQGTLRKRYFFSYGNQNIGPYQFSWVEGLGSPEKGISNFLETLCAVPEVNRTLLCIQDSSENLFYQNPAYNRCFLSISLDEKGLVSFSIFPNPSSQKFHLQWEGSALQVSVANSLGKEILNQSCESGCDLNLENQPAGIYVVRVFEKEKFLGARKIFKN